MSSEIVPLRPAQIVSPPSARDTVDGWLPMFEPVARLAAEIAQTEFIPAGLRGKPAAITAAILYGREIGLGPIQSLQSVDVIDGRPAISAEMGRALALAAGHELFIEESTTARCVGSPAPPTTTGRLARVGDHHLDARRRQARRPGGPKELAHAPAPDAPGPRHL